MRVVVLALIFAISLTGCSSSQDSIVADDAEIIEGARSTLRDTLKDPSSAEFRNEKVGFYEGRAVVCGEVNSNNSFGGKTGFQRYVAANASAVVTEEAMDPLEFETVWARICY